jgi:hypothetical protein
LVTSVKIVEVVVVVVQAAVVPIQPQSVFTTLVADACSFRRASDAATLFGTSNRLRGSFSEVSRRTFAPDEAPDAWLAASVVVVVTVTVANSVTTGGVLPQDERTQDNEVSCSGQAYTVEVSVTMVGSPVVTNSVIVGDATLMVTSVVKVLTEIVEAVHTGVGLGNLHAQKDVAGA